MKPIKLATRPPISQQIKDDCVDILRKALAKAEAGDMETVLVICKNDDGTWSDEHSGTMRMGEAIGYLEIIKQEWINRYLADK